MPRLAMKTFSLVNLGCKVNRVESDDAMAFLLDAGWSNVPLDEADVIVVNTCTVTGEADKKTRKAVHRALAAGNAARVLVTGCAAAIAPEVFEGMSPRVRVVPKAALMDCLARLVDSDVRDSTQDPRPDDPSSPRKDNGFLLRAGDGFNTRIGVKVQDGCAHACTYCIVHVARGMPWSKPAQAVREEVRAYACAGAREIVLTGINLGSYRDVDLDLTGLLRVLLADASAAASDCAPGQQMRIRLSSIEPMDVDEGLIELLAHSEGLLCRHLHLPVQSGSTKVLGEMGRPYSAHEYLALASRLREAVPSISLSTDIIAGFPGETAADFAESMALCRQVGFSKMHVFPYSRRDGTPAAARSDQVDAETKAMRARELRALAEELRRLDFASRTGTVDRALAEPGGVGLTESYYEVPSPDGTPENTFFSCRMVEYR